VYWTSEGSAYVGYLTLTFTGGGSVAMGGKPLGIAVESQSVYWTDIAQGTVNQYPQSGGGAISVSGQISPAGIALDSNNVYWTTLGTVDGGGTVMAAPIGQIGSPQPLALGQALPFGIVADGVGNVYWQNLGTPPSYSDGTIMMTAGDGGGLPSLLATGQRSGALRSQGPVGIMAVNSNNLYWIANGDIMWLQLHGGALAPLGVGGAPQGIAIDAKNLSTRSGRTS
jgi:hypothetical protein